MPFVGSYLFPWLSWAWTALAIIVTAIALESLLRLSRWCSKLKLGTPTQVALSRPSRMYYPFVNPMGVMNLRPMSEDAMAHGLRWIDVDGQYLVQLELKRMLMTMRREQVFGEMLEVRACEASLEALELIVGTLQAEYPGLVERCELGRLINTATGYWWWYQPSEQPAAQQEEQEHPLVVAAMLVQEDLAVMMPGPGGEYVLAAAAICFADQWSVPSKVGRSLTAIHEPASTYQRTSAATNKFFTGLKVGAEKVRYNFTFCERPSLHLPEEPGPDDCPLPQNGLPHAIYLRVERQVLLRLPKSGGVLFTIRTYRQNVQDVPRRHHAALLAALEPGSRTTPLKPETKLQYCERIRKRLSQLH